MLMQEASILIKLRHDNLVNLFRAINSNNQFYVLMELMDAGPLSNFIKAHTTLRGMIPERFCRFILRQIAKGLYHVHSMNVLHRDIKSENILLGSRGEVKLADFGFSKRYNRGSERYTKVGT